MPSNNVPELVVPQVHNPNPPPPNHPVAPVDHNPQPLHPIPPGVPPPEPGAYVPIYHAGNSQPGHYPPNPPFYHPPPYPAPGPVPFGLPPYGIPQPLPNHAYNLPLLHHPPLPAHVHVPEPILAPADPPQGLHADPPAPRARPNILVGPGGMYFSHRIYEVTKLNSYRFTQFGCSRLGFTVQIMRYACTRSSQTSPGWTS